MPLPELDLTLRYETRFLSEKWNDRENEKVVVKTDIELQQYEIQLLISDEEIGKVQLRIAEQWVELPTYKLTVTDTKTQEISVFEVTRDVLRFSKEVTKRSLISFLGIKKFDKQVYLYENIAFEPHKDTISSFELSGHRKGSQEQFLYRFKKENETLLLYAGDMKNTENQNANETYYCVVDGKNGQSFISDMLYREKILKHISRVSLQMVGRKKVAKEFTFDSKGKLDKKVYL